MGSILSKLKHTSLRNGVLFCRYWDAHVRVESPAFHQSLHNLVTIVHREAGEIHSVIALLSNSLTNGSWGSEECSPKATYHWSETWCNLINRWNCNGQYPPVAKYSQVSASRQTPKKCEKLYLPSYWKWTRPNEFVIVRVPILLNAREPRNTIRT
jgi:hypothetical protein